MKKGVVIALICLPWPALAQLNYTPYTFTTFAGSPGVTGFANGTNRTARFFDPGGVAMDSSNNVYVADQRNNLIREMTPKGVVTTIAGGLGANSSGFRDGTNSFALFNQASGVVVDAAGDIFVADLGNNAIRKITPSGTNWITTTIAGSGFIGSSNGTNSSASFFGPHALVLDASNNIFVADEHNQLIREITQSGTNWIVTTIAGQARVQGVADGTNTAALFSDPSGLAIDTNGVLYVGDLNAVRTMTLTGTNWVVTTIAGSVTNSGAVDGTNGAARFASIHGVAVDGAGNIVAADVGNDLIRQVTPEGTNWVVTTLAGQSTARGTNDGAGAAAAFFSPCSVAIDTFGNLFVADFVNDTIRKGFPFAITNQPQSQGTALGTDVELGVSLFGNGPFSYQWTFDGAPLSGENNPTLELDSVQRTNSGLYSVIVTGPDTNDVVASSNAMLRVLVTPVMQPPQFSTNGFVSLQFQDSDGGVPFDLNDVTILWRTNLPTSTDTNWQTLTTGFYLTNGFVELDDTNTIGLPSAFYQILEH